MADGVMGYAGRSTPADPTRDAKGKLSQYKRWFEEARDLLADARREAETDRDYFDGKQWTPEEKAALQRRKQPAQTYNLVKVAVNGMVGVVERTQTDPKAWPRNQNDDQAAETATAALRFVADQTKFDRVKVRAAKTFFVEGVAAIITEVEPDKVDYKVTIREVPFKEFFFDPYSQAEDFSDARYMGVAKWMDLDRLQALYPEQKDQLAQSLDSPIAADDTFYDRPWQGWTDKRRRRLMAVELYHNEVDGWRRCVFVAGLVLEADGSPYTNEDGQPCCPIEAASFARDRENMPYGAVRDLRSPQDGYNKRQSKLLHMLNVRQTFGRSDVVKDVSALKAELAKPDGHVELEHGEFGKDFGVLPITDQIAGQFQLLQEARAQMDRLLPNPGILGREVDGQSGRAIQAQQNAGMTELADAFGALTDLELRVYRQIWWRIKQFWTAPRWVRVTDDLGAPQYIGLNQQMQQQDEFGFPMQEMQNAVAELDVDITLDVTPESANRQAEEFDALSKMAANGIPIPPDVLIEMSSLKNKARLVQKIQEAQQMAAQQPNPEMMKLEADKQKADADLQMKGFDLQLKDREAQMKMRELDLKEQELAMGAQERSAQMDMEREHATREHEYKMTDLNTRAEGERMKVEAERAPSDALAQIAQAIQEGNQQSAEALAQAAMAIAEAVQGIGQAVNTMSAAADQMSKPRRRMIERGPDGRAIGMIEA